jgi:Chromo (CHRromatin Organisation MOdifier) domain
MEPIAMKDCKLVKKNNQPVVEVLVKWSNLNDEDSTWEEYDQLKL